MNAFKKNEAPSYASEEEFDGSKLEESESPTNFKINAAKLKKIPTVKPKHIDKIMFEIEMAEMIK